MLILTALLALLVGLFFFSIYLKRKSLEDKVIEKSKLCNRNDTIYQSPELYFHDFEATDLKELRFQIIRNQEIVRDSTLIVKEKFAYLVVPFKEFLKTDIIVITTKSKLQYQISNFKYVVGLNYGMLGPVAVSDCMLHDSYTINETEDTNDIIKSQGVLVNQENN